MRFLTGKDYPHLCSWCRRAIDDMVGLYRDGLMADTDDPEAPCDAVYDHNLYCGGSHCVNKGGDAQTHENAALKSEAS
jgi:hypothetical protein